MDAKDIKYKYLTTEDEVQQVYKMMSIPEIAQWTGTPLFPPFIREGAKKKQFIVAKYEDRVVGFINANYNKKLKYNVIHYRCVHPEFQGMGIASRLTKLIPPPHMAKCKLENEKIQSLYRKFGMYLADIEIRTASRHGKTHTYKIAVYKSRQ